MFGVQPTKIGCEPLRCWPHIDLRRRHGAGGGDIGGVGGHGNSLGSSTTGLNVCDRKQYTRSLMCAHLGTVRVLVMQGLHL